MGLMYVERLVGKKIAACGRLLFVGESGFWGMSWPGDTIRGWWRSGLSG